MKRRAIGRRSTANGPPLPGSARTSRGRMAFISFGKSNLSRLPVILGAKMAGSAIRLRSASLSNSVLPARSLLSPAPFEVLCGQGIPRVDAIRQVQTTEQTFCLWRKQYGGMGTDQLKELKRFQKENDRLRRTVGTAQTLCDLPDIICKLLVLLNVQLLSPLVLLFGL